MTYVGIDISQSMLDLAKVRCPDYTFSLGDAEALKYENDSFDVYLSSLCLQIVANPTKMMQVTITLLSISRVLEEAYRVLKPGGRNIKIIHRLIFAY